MAMADLAGIQLERLTGPGLAAAFRSAPPFPHVVIDELVEEAARRELMDAMEDEPASVIRDQIFEMTASAVRVEDARLRRFHAALETPEVLSAVEALSGKRVRRADLRAFAYEPGHYLLPHTDHQEGVGRAVAYAYYLDTSPDLEGGELALFHVEVEDGEIVKTRTATVIAPRRNRIILFDVSDTSLHEVREVTRGSRLSLAGWFYP
jgi:Rps23 Pro-64 3,4-dihydroxylase Tpa1-like proline 4-hydroxylase